MADTVHLGSGKRYPNAHGAVTKGDSGTGLANGELPYATSSVFIMNPTAGTADIVITDRHGNDATYKLATLQHFLLEGNFARVKDTGTTAGLTIIAHWHQ